MAARLATQPLQRTQDHSLQVLGMGAWGAQVVALLRQEFDRLQISAQRVALHVWNPTQAPGGNNLFQEFDAAAILRDARHASLRQHLSHVPIDELIEDGTAPFRYPASAFLALHANAAHVLHGLQASLDALRQANPDNPLRMILVGNLGEACMAGAALPLLAQLRPHLLLRKVDVELWAATGEGLAADAQEQRDSDLICAGGLEQWQRVVVGEEGFRIPGTQGLREDRLEQGPLLSQVMLFSGGVDEQGHASGVQASILANNLLCLETTLLHKRLQEERDYHGEEVLEQSWKNTLGAWVSTRGATFHAGGIKADCLPEIFHLRTVRHFVDTVTQSAARSSRDKARAAAMRCVEDGRLGANEIIHDLELGRSPLTQQEIRNSKIPKPQLHDFIKQRLDEDLGELLDLATQETPPAPYTSLMERAQQHCDVIVRQLSNAEGTYLPAAIEFYRSLEKDLVRLRDGVQERGAWAQRELGHSPSCARLDRLLVRLDDDLTDHGDDLHGRFAETLTVALPIQIRKILEVASEIREHARIVGTAPLLQRFYTELLNACESRRDALQKLIYELNAVSSACLRQEEQVLRTARSAFTYQKGRFEELAEAAWGRARNTAGGVQITDMLQRLGSDITLLDPTEDLQTQLLDAARPEADKLIACGEEVLATEPRSRHALQNALLQLHPTVDIQRQRFEGLQTLRRRFVVCSRAFLREHSDLLEDHQHIEATSPWNVWVSEHEEGFPFEVVRQVADCMARFRDAANRQAARLACATIEDVAHLELQDDIERR